MTKTTRILVAGCLSLVAVACSPGSSMTSTGSDSGSNNSQSTGSDKSAMAVQAEQAVNGTVSSGTYGGVQSIQLDTVNGNLILNVPMGINPFLTVSSGSISQLPDITFATTVASDGTDFLTVTIPLKYVLHGVTTLPSSTTLPNGDPLPNMPSTSYPAVAFSIDTNQPSAPKVDLYIGVAAIGVYVESPYISCGSLPICLNSLTIPIENSSHNKDVGFLTLVMPKAPATGGVFVSTIIPNDVAVLLENFID